MKFVIVSLNVKIHFQTVPSNFIGLLLTVNHKSSRLKISTLNSKTASRGH